MVGYKIRYQLVRRGGIDITLNNPPVVITFDRFVFNHEITGLLSYSDYKVEIFGFAPTGDGPSHTVIASRLIFCVGEYK